ncbi:M56 family metallopeptidase [Flavihumibacter sp. UBA7668]|uniref:M56 family metallopeptidase n=1 Tax=Flavihumibacter sp. UBA7668 TaxID=1946542 RepID=UPI0025B94A00|nr:M56 family metallopeptidase [Flavihumibacter sp. UBA7668]
MNEFIAYLLKFSISLSLVTLFYQVFLRRITFYNWNRWYLIIYPLACLFLPLLDIGWWMEEGSVKLTALKELPAWGNWKPGVQSETTEPMNYWSFLYVALVAGSGFMLIRLLLQYLSIIKLSKRAKWLAGEEVKLFSVEDSIIPFSFGRSVFVNPSLHSEEDLKEIIRHEMVHVRQHHTADMMLGELLLVLNWFNPFAWMLRHAIRQNLEFIADRQVLTHGIDRKQYQYLLVKVVGQRNFSMASHLNFSALKTRIAMMNKIRSARIHLVKFAFAVPLAAVLLLAFRKKSEASQDGLQEQQTELKSYGNPVLRMLDALPENRVNSDAKTSEFFPGLLGKTIDTIPGKKGVYVFGPNEKGYYFRVTEKNGVSTVTILDKKKKLLKSMTLEEWEANEVENEKKYGELAPPPPPPPPPPAPAAPAAVPAPAAKAAPAAPSAPAAPAAPAAPTKKGIVIVSEGSPVMELDDNQNSRITGSAITIRAAEGAASPIYFVDGKEWDKDDISLIDPKRIKAINVLKGENATAVYGEKAKDGVLLIETKRGDAREETINKTIPDNPLEPITVVGYAKPAGLPPLYIVDGKEMSADEFKQIKPESIESIMVWKDKKAIDKYGSKGKNGVLVIELKKQ